MDALPRKPLAFGMQKWGPLPGSSYWLLWGGPGERLMLWPGDPGDIRVMPGRYIQHPSANGVYYSVKGASKAAQAFADAGAGETP